MKKRSFLILVVIAVLLMVTAGVSAKSNTHFEAHLTGDAEVPNPVDTLAVGQAIFRVVDDGTAIEYRLIVANLEDLTMAHIHLAPAGQNGPVVAWLYPSSPPPMLKPGTTNGVLATGRITADDLVGPLAGHSLHHLIEYMEQGMTYVNVHTLEYPGGEIRGQIK